ncbi:MAG: hypothetical protein WC872_02645 [Candidatus Absconditabacterales bacterium]
MNKKKIILCFFLLFFFSFTFAHQPRLIFEKTNSETNPIIIKNPEISQAFYGELKGNPDFYKISSNTGFLLYAQLTSPDISGAQKNFSAKISSKKKLIKLIDGKNFQRGNFFEKFAGDNYNQGPEFSKNVESGDYFIQIFNPNNSGKYVLAIGKIESFPLNESISTIKILPKLKTDFFQKPAYTAFFNVIGLFLGGSLILLIFIIWIIYKLIKNII